MAYDGSIDLINGLRPKNNGTFPLVAAKDVYVDDATRLDAKLQQLGSSGNFAPAYSASATYAVGDYAMYNGQLYECKTAITTAEEWTAAHWTAVSVGGEISVLKSAINHLAYKQTGKNLFDPSAEGVIVGHYIDTSGNPTPLSQWNISDYIPVSGLTAITASVWNANGSYFAYGGLHYLHTYDAEKRHIRKVWDTSTNGVYNIESNVAFIRFCWEPNNETGNGRKIMIENGSVHSESYESYRNSTYLVDSAYPTENEVENIVENKLASELAPIEDKANLIYQQRGSKNIFNPNAEGVVEGEYLDTSGSLISLSSWNTSDYIPVNGLSSIVGSVWTANGSYFTYCKLSLMHKYDINKNHLGKIWDTSTDGVWAVTDGVAYVRFCWQPNNETSDGRKIMIESGTEHSSVYEAYSDDVVTFLQKSAYPTFEDVNSMIQEGGISDDIIVCYGDSLTYSHNTTIPDYPYLGNVTYPSKLAELTGKATYNLGMPGANSMDISGLQGGMPIYVDPFTLPASTSSDAVTLRDANGESNYIGIMHWSMDSSWPNPVTNMGLEWNLDGIRVKLVYSSGVYKIRRIENASNDTVFTRPVKLTPVHNFQHGKIMVFWIGTNDAPASQNDAERIARIAENMAKFSGVSKYLVVGLTVKNYANAANVILAQTFGNHYVDVKDYLIRYGLADNNLSPAEQDTADINNGVVPTSLRSDSVHFNDYGYTVIANCVYRHGKDLGYWN